MSIREDMKQALKRYSDHGIPTGDFLLAVLENNLLAACCRADMENQGKLFEIVKYIFAELPPTIWGSPEKVAVHIARRQAERWIRDADNG